MGQALVRKSMLDYHSGWKFTSCLYHFLQKLLNFLNNYTYLNMILSSILFDNIVNKIIAKSLWLWPNTSFYHQNSIEPRKIVPLSPKCDTYTSLNFIPRILCLWSNKMRILFLPPFVHLLLNFSIISNCTMDCTLWPM